MSEVVKLRSIVWIYDSALEDFRRTLDSFRIAGYGGGHE
jgi:hypothetical protein